MREIKFRAWDKKLEVMDGMLYMDFAGKIFDSMYGELEAADRENFVIMQYTGLKDQNGTEIYEGDIVRLEIDEVGVVEWDEDCARFIISESNITIDFDNYWGFELEVIGNTFERPELLDGEHDD